MNPLIMPVLSHLFDLFKRRRFIRDRVIPLIEEADGRPDSLKSNQARREWVVNVLRENGLSESEARLLTESGLSLYRRLQAKAAKKAARKAKRARIVESDRPATLHRPDLGEADE